MILLLLGCVEFEGDEGRLGFSSNLIAPGSFYLQFDPRQHLVARGTQVEVLAERRMDLDGDEAKEPQVHARVRGGELLEHETGRALFTARRKARVSWEGEVQDHFTVRFAPVRRLDWVDHAGLFTSYEPLERVVLLDATLLPMPADRRGRPLAWAEEDLALEHDCPEDERGRLSSPEAGLSCRLEARMHGQSATVELLGEAPPAHLELLETTFESEDGPVRVLVLKAQTAEGVPVLGLDAEWTGAEPLKGDLIFERGDVAVAEGSGPVSAKVGSLEARLD